MGHQRGTIPARLDIKNIKLGRTLISNLNRILRALIRRCLKRAPEERPSMEDIIGELEQSLFFQQSASAMRL